MSRLLLVCLAFATTVGANPPSQDFAARLSALQLRWEKALHAADVPGLAVVVTDREGVLYSWGFGCRSLEPSLPFAPDTPAYIASVTKVFTAAAILQLVEARTLELDAPVKRYLPCFALRDSKLAASISVRDLLCHRYGLSSDPIVFAEAYTGQLSDDFFYRELPHAEIAGKWEYSNLHFTLLGRIIQSVTGEDWRDYLERHIFQPLKMEGTTARARGLYGSQVSAVPLERVDNMWVAASTRKSDATMHAAGGLGASALDLATWLRVMLGAGATGSTRILSEASVQEMLTPQARPGTEYLQFERPEMGLGWYLGRYRGELLVHHFGSYIGAHAHASFMPSAGIGVAILANWDDSARPLIHQIAADIYDARRGIAGDDPWPRLLSEIAREAGKSGGRDARPKTLNLRWHQVSCAGTFTSERWGTLELYVKDGKLAGQIGDFPLVFVRGRRNRAEIDTPLGRKYLKFSSHGPAVNGVTLEGIWGHDLVFTRVGGLKP